MLCKHKAFHVRVLKQDRMWAETVEWLFVVCLVRHKQRATKVRRRYVTNAFTGKRPQHLAAETESSREAVERRGTTWARSTPHRVEELRSGPFTKIHEKQTVEHVGLLPVRFRIAELFL